MATVEAKAVVEAIRSAETRGQVTAMTPESQASSARWITVFYAGV